MSKQPAMQGGSEGDDFVLAFLGSTGKAKGGFS